VNRRCIGYFAGRRDPPTDGTKSKLILVTCAVFLELGALLCSGWKKWLHQRRK